MTIYHRFGAPVTLAAAAEVDDGTRIAFIDFPREDGTTARQLAEVPYLRADDGLREIDAAFKAAEATTDQKTKLKLITEFREMEARHARSLAGEDDEQAQ